MIENTCTEGDGTQPQAGRGDTRVLGSRILGFVLIGFTLIDLLIMFGAGTGPGGHLDVIVESVSGVYFLARADRIQREGWTPRNTR